MSNERIESVKASRYFYRDSYRRVCRLLAVMLVLILLLGLANIYFFIIRPAPNFYATSMDGKLVQLAPLDKPNYSDTPLIQ